MHLIENIFFHAPRIIILLNNTHAMCQVATIRANPYRYCNMIMSSLCGENLFRGMFVWGNHDIIGQRISRYKQPDFPAFVTPFSKPCEIATFGNKYPRLVRPLPLAIINKGGKKNRG